ncbi:MAG: hypothetical protein ABI818_19775, partial [Acidobacteriota bacterium]
PDPGERSSHPRGSGLGARNSADPGLRTPDPGSRTPDPITVAIDIMDEAHSLRLAMRRLGSDAALRAALGAAAARSWAREHSMPLMLDDYARVLAAAAARRAPRVQLPPHLVTDGDRVLRRLLGEMGMADVWREVRR